MLFNSWAYLVFLPVVFGLYWSLPKEARVWLLLAASALFYGWWNATFLLLMGASILVDYVAARGIHAAATPRGRKLWLLTSLTANLGILGLFKYLDFFLESGVELAQLLGLSVDPVVLGLVLPVGVSFYTFQSMAYTIDVYRGQLEPTKNLAHFAAYVSFFPQLVAGPIERARHLLPQVQFLPGLDKVQWKAALHLIVWGLYKKVFVADNLARIVGQCLDHPQPTLGEVSLGTFAFAFQIYCDFSGYTDVARGSANLLGFSLCENFRAPYFAVSPSDFWQRWHISLSAWLRDYLYIPLGGNRGGTLRTYGRSRRRICLAHSR